MKYYELDKYEQELSDAIENGDFELVDNQAGIRRHAIEMAKATTSKTKTINIRIPERVLLNLKERAAEEGIPYQTLAASILHKNTR